MEMGDYEQVVAAQRIVAAAVAEVHFQDADFLKRRKEVCWQWVQAVQLLMPEQCLPGIGCVTNEWGIRKDSRRSRMTIQLCKFLDDCIDDLRAIFYANALYTHSGVNIWHALWHLCSVV